MEDDVKIIRSCRGKGKDQRHGDTERRKVFDSALWSRYSGKKKMREQTDRSEGKMRHRLLKHLGIAALRG